MPELYNANCLIQMYSSGANPFITNEVKNKVELLRDRFFIIVFSVDKTEHQIESLRLVSFTGIDANNNVIIGNQQTIYHM